MANLIRADNGASSGVTGIVQTADSSGQLALQTTTSGGTATTALTIDNSQNVGIGVTPSAWRTSYSQKAIQFGPVGFVYSLSAASNNNATVLGSNYYLNGSGNFVYINSDYATSYYQTNGQHQWYVAPSGTSGNTFSSTQAMTLDNSGIAYIGATSGLGSRLNLIKDTNSTVENLLWLRNSGTGYKGARITFGEYTTVNGYITNQYISSGPNWCTDIGSTNLIRFFIGSDPGTEAARIDSSGNLGLGVTPASWSGRTAFQIGTAGQMNYGSGISNGGSMAYGNNGYWNGSADKAITTGYSQIVALNDNGTGRVIILTTSGTSSAGASISYTAGPYVSAGNNSWTNSSDERLKNITGLITNGLESVNTLRAARYTWKDDLTNKPKVGLIAQDVQKVLPEAVETFTKYNSEDTTEYLGVTYTEVIPLLVAAIQELSAELTALKAKVGA